MSLLHFALISHSALPNVHAPHADAISAPRTVLRMDHTTSQRCSTAVALQQVGEQRLRIGSSAELLEYICLRLRMFNSACHAVMDGLE